MAMSEQAEPIDPKRVKAFAVFFKRYMSISTLVVASLPIPVTALGAIPTFKAHTKLLSVYTPLFCFLILGFIFYSRHKLARIMFPEHISERGFISKLSRINRAIIRSLPFWLIVLSVISVVSYHALLNFIVRDNFGIDVDFNKVLESTPSHAIPLSSTLMFLYLSIFVMAEGAFILMAIKEYLQDLVGLTEIDLIKGPPPPKIIHDIKPVTL